MVHPAMIAAFLHISGILIFKWSDFSAK